MKGPAVFLAQLISHAAPSDTLPRATHMIRKAGTAFDGFAGGSNPGLNRAMLGLT
ncbi:MULTISPECIES: hypothetical protein [unclassified Sphingomonas]|uniref:hypothetical protein n=1 Tax=unclassified Sphingomonas TaxID=196159 RepID=UPI000B0B45D6|nr:MULTISPECIES: hypothetical protein [unclassified Sphingomonas]